jgi:hypothetical protein
MNVVHKLALGLLLAGTLIWVVVSAAQSQTPGGVTRPGGPGEWGKTPLSNRALDREPLNSDTKFSPYSVQSQPAQLAKQYVKAEKDEEKKEIRKKLTEFLTQQFDQHLQQQQRELDDLEKQIASLRAVLKKRLSSKTAIVERRFEQLVEDAEGLGWNTPSSLHRPSSSLGDPKTPQPQEKH